MWKSIRRADVGRLLGRLRQVEPVLLRVVLGERLDLKAAAELFVKRQVPPLLRAGRRIDREDRVFVIADEMLLDGEIGFICGVVA